MVEYCLYLDEENISPSNPYFCLAGIIVDRKIYNDTIITEINNLKLKYFNKTDVVFHYTDMKNNKNEFKILKDIKISGPFWQEFNSIIEKLNFTTIGTYIDYNKLFNIHGLRKNECYELAFTRLINNYILFLKKNNGLGSVIFESLTWKDNKNIQNVFFHILNYGTDMYSDKVCSKYLSTIGFLTKKENSVGLEIADFVPNSFVRNINGNKNFHNVGTNFLNKRFMIGKEYDCGLLKIN